MDGGGRPVLLQKGSLHFDCTSMQHLRSWELQAYTHPLTGQKLAGPDAEGSEPVEIDEAAYQESPRHPVRGCRLVWWALSSRSGGTSGCDRFCRSLRGEGKQGRCSRAQGPWHVPQKRGR